MEVQLGPVERAVTLVDHILLAQFGNGLSQHILREAPVLFVTDVILRHG